MLYWFELVRDQSGARFVPHQIDDDSGVGTHFLVIDVDADGRLDIVTANKRGLHYSRRPAGRLLRERPPRERKPCASSGCPSLAALVAHGMHPVREMKIAEVQSRLTDRRGRRVVFLSHCLLNENTRYLGGAGRRACVRELVERCDDEGAGMVQMPCPEQEAWGGVLKRRLLGLYGVTAGRPVASRALRAALPAALRYVRWRFRRIARRVAAQVADYVASGFEVVAIVGVDGSPSCGVDETLQPECACALAETPPEDLTTVRQEAILRRFRSRGSGTFVDELRRELRRRGLVIPFLAHDLFAELDGRATTVLLRARSSS